MATAVNIPKWTASGDWFDVCRFNVPCLCEFSQTPTNDDCDGMAIFFDEKANDQQKEALNMIFSGRDGSFMAEIANLIGEVRGIEYAPIKFEIADDLSYWNAEILGKVLAKAEALTGPATPAGKSANY